MMRQSRGSGLGARTAATQRPARTAARCLLVVLLALGVLAAAARDAAAAPPAPGSPAPPFAAPLADGTRLDLAQLRGKVVLLHFWATWCDACRVEMPALAQVLGELHGQGLELLAVSADEPHDARAALAMAAMHQLPAALLSAARPNGFGSPPVLPITYVIDRAGVVRARLMPTRAPLDEAALRAAVTPWLAAGTGDGGPAAAAAISPAPAPVAP